MQKLEQLLSANPFIAAIRSETDLMNVLHANAKIVFILHGTIQNVKLICQTLKKNNKIVFIHIDMIDGLKADIAGVSYLKDITGIDGIITAKQNVVKIARSLHLFSILRLFIIDSRSVVTGIKSASEFQPDAVEVMPGTIFKTISFIKKNISIPIIAGGLISEKEEADSAIKNGAVAISSSTYSLLSWDTKRKGEHIYE